MAEELFIPKLGQTVEEVTIIEWLADDGAKVDFGTPILDVETDKAVFPLEANASGYLHRGPFTSGEIVPVLTVVAIIGKKDDVFEVSPVKLDSVAAADGTTQTAATNPEPIPTTLSGSDEKVFASPRARKLAAQVDIDLRKISPTGGGGVRVTEGDIVSYLSTIPKATPLAQNVAEREGVDLSTVQGTGARGKITKQDVQSAITEKELSPIESPMLMSSDSLQISQQSTTQTIPLKGVKKIIFEKMAASVHTTARVTLVTDVDASRFVEIREQLKSRVSESWGFVPGYNDLLALIIIRSLVEFPYMNARLNTEGTEIHYLSSINLGLAVDTERGLLVPVLKNAASLGLRELGLAYRNLIDRAREGRSLPEDLSEGTFTMTNLGMFEIDAFTPVINMPELAILGVGRIAEKVVPVAGKPEVRKMLTLSLVFDHRLVDGAPAAKFLQKIKEYIEHPYLLIG